MRPILFSIGDIQISAFYFMLILGALACAFYCHWVGGRRGLRREIFLDFGMVGIIGGFIGARILHILVEAPGYYWEDPLRVLAFWQGGSVSFGAFLGGGLSIVAYLRIRKLDILPYTDVVVLGLPLIHLCGRIACLLIGCCYGKPTDLPWAITFSNSAATVYKFYPNIPIHPSQIYEMIQALSIFIGINLFYFKKRDRFPGQCLPIFFIAYLIPRGIIEFSRGDLDRGLWFNGLMSTGQIAAVIGTVFFVFLYVHLRKRAQTS